jgi:hypothetical protein
MSITKTEKYIARGIGFGRLEDAEFYEVCQRVKDHTDTYIKQNPEATREVVAQIAVNAVYGSCGVILKGRND